MFVLCLFCGCVCVLCCSVVLCSVRFVVCFFFSVLCVHCVVLVLRVCLWCAMCLGGVFNVVLLVLRV